DQNWRRPRGDNRGDRRHSRVRYRDDLVARTDVERAQRDDQGIGAAAGSDSMRNAAIIGKGTLKAFDFAAENIGAAVEDTCYRRLYRVLVRTVLRGGRRPGHHEITLTSGT